MTKGLRRQSQNSMLMRSILQHLREYDLSEVKLLCERYEAKENAKGGRKSRSKRDEIVEEFIEEGDEVEASEEFPDDL